jgi:autotransporter-associated beta strand protein
MLRNSRLQRVSEEVCLLAAIAAAVLCTGTVWAATIDMSATDGSNTSSFNTGLHWTGGLAPTAGNAYRVISPNTSTRILRTPAAAGNFTFAGDSLSLMQGSSSTYLAYLLYKGTGAGNTITVNNLILNGGVIQNGMAAPNKLTLAGNITLQPSHTSFISSNDQADSIEITAKISGAGTSAITKMDIGTCTFSNATNDYTGPTTVSGGRLLVNGSIATSSGVSVASGATLGGYGAVSAVSGAGLVDPGGNGAVLAASLRAASINPASGLSLGWEFTATGSPVYNIASASTNDVLHLTGATPLSSNLTSANQVGVVFDVASLVAGNQFRGGVYEDVATDFLSTVSDATYNYFVLGDGSGTHAYNGVNYYTLAEYDPAMTVVVSTVAETANFGSGDIGGRVMQFTLVPEPGALALLASGLFGLLAYAWRRRK